VSAKKHGGLLQKTRKERRKATMREENRREIVEKLGEEIKIMIKGLLERLMVEEQAMYLENYPTKANGYYSRDLLTLYGPMEDLRVPRVREGDFRPALLPERRRASLDLSDAILVLYAAGVSTRAISRFLETIYGSFYSPKASPA